MQGPLTMIGDGRLTILDLFEERLKVEHFDASVILELERMAQEAKPEFEKRTKEYTSALEAERQLKRDLAELAALKKDASEQFTTQLMVSAHEAASTLSTCDASSVASRLRAIQDTLQLWQDAEDLLLYIQIPAARLKMLEAVLALRQGEELMANLAAGLTHARTVNALIQGGIYRADNRVGIVSQEVEELRAFANEAGRLTKLAESELRDYQQRKTAATQMRMANALLTRVEAASAR
jgi:hypothetical protein